MTMAGGSVRSSDSVLGYSSSGLLRLRHLRTSRMLRRGRWSSPGPQPGSEYRSLIPIIQRACPLGLVLHMSVNSQEAKYLEGQP